MLLVMSTVSGTGHRDVTTVSGKLTNKRNRLNTNASRFPRRQGNLSGKRKDLWYIHVWSNGWNKWKVCEGQVNRKI